MKTKLTDVEINLFIAQKVMGWTLEKDSWTNRENKWAEHRHNSGDDWAWCPSTSITDSFEMEEEIFKQGKHREYGLELFNVIKGERILFKDVSDFDVAHASPKQRCLAALRCYGVEV